MPRSHGSCAIALPTCPKCGYSSDGLPLSPGGLLRCPECGERFFPGTLPQLSRWPWLLAALAAGLFPALILLSDAVFDFGLWPGDPRLPDPPLSGFILRLFIVSPLVSIAAGLCLGTAAAIKWRVARRTWPLRLVAQVLLLSGGLAIVTWVVTVFIAMIRYSDV